MSLLKRIESARPGGTGAPASSPPGTGAPPPTVGMPPGVPAPAARLLAVMRPWWLSALVALGIGAYDGFFGPGTGTFLIIAFTLIWSDPLDQASANAKVVNFASNLGALLTFALSGKVLWLLALPMITGQAAGGYLGAHVTVRHGQGVVRIMVVLISLALIARLAWSMLHQ